VIPAEFDYVAADSLEDAIRLLGDQTRIDLLGHAVTSALFSAA
jgi:hypothetical protein